MKLERIDILSVPVSDQREAKQFYTEALGFEVIRDNPMGPDQRWIQLAPRGAETSITLVTWFDSMPAGSIQGLVLTTVDLDADFAELQSRGVDLSEIETAEWGRYTTFTDPDGNGWVLHESTSEQ